MLRKFWSFWTAAFSTPTIIDDVVQRTHKASADVHHCDALIEKAQFQKHMALHELVALEAWNHGKVLADMPQVGAGQDQPRLGREF